MPHPISTAIQYSTLILGSIFLTLELLWTIARSCAVDTTTAMREVTRLGSTRASGRISGTAIIAGGSVSGLTTAIVCSKFFDKVIVVEPDSMAEVKRTRVAQAEQIHGLQAVTLCILRAIIPYFDDRVHKFGGRILESNAQLQLGATNVKFAPGSLPDTVFISRLALEQMLRAYVQEISNIQAIQGAVVGIVPDVTGHRIEKVLVQLKGDSNPTTELEAAMLADCSGPASIGLKLLEKTQGAGWGPYPKISYDPKISYATALVPVVDRLRESLPIFTRETGDYSNFEKLGYLKCIIPHAEQDDRIVCIIRADDNNLMCGIGGWDLSPDARPHAFSDYLQQVDSIWQNASNGASSEGNSNRMAVMDSLHVIEDALAEDGVVPQFKFCRMGPCYKIDYSTAPKPSNFVAIGDSFLRVNPTFGQGVSKALVDIASLNGALLDTKLLNARGWCLPDTFSTEMIERQYPRVMHMWDSTKDSDYGRRSTDCVTGESSDLGAFGRRYWRGVVRIASQDKAVAADIIKSLQLIAPPLDLLRPSLFVRAMWSVMREAVYKMNSKSGAEESFTFTVGKLDAGMAILIGERAHLIEFPSLLLPPGVTSGSIVNISVNRNLAEEKRQQKEFWDLQDAILETFGKVAPEPPALEVRNVTQTSVTLEWPLIKLATAKLRSLDIYRNGQRLASIPSPTTNTSTKLSGLDVNTEYTFQLILRTTAGTFPSNVIRLRTHTITDTSGISVCFGTVQDTVMLERAKLVLREMRAKWSDKIQIDTTHFVCTTPAAAPASGQASGGPSVEYQKALQMSIPVVQPHWILACHAEKKMVPISGYYLGATPSAPMNAPPFTRPSPQTSNRDSLQSPQSGAATGTAEVDHAPSPETRARQSETRSSSSEHELPPVPAIKVDAHEDKLDDAELERARDAPIGTEPRSRSGTMKSDFKFPPPTPPPSVPQIVVGHHDDDETSKANVEVGLGEDKPEELPKKQEINQESADDEVGETVEVDLN